MWVGPYLIKSRLGKGFYQLQQLCGKGPVTTIPRVSYVHIKVYCPVHLQEKFNHIQPPMNQLQLLQVLHQQLMRKHLVESPEKQNFTAFPIQKIWCHGSKMRHSAYIPIHCICRLPKSEGIKLIECSYCGIW